MEDVAYSHGRGRCYYRLDWGCSCSAPGTVTITASAPQNLQFTVNNGVQNTFGHGLGYGNAYL